MAHKLTKPQQKLLEVEAGPSSLVVARLKVDGA